MTIHYKGTRAVFEADRPCQLNGKRYKKGDLVAIRMNRDWDDDVEWIGEGGPWGWAGFTSKFVASLGQEDYS